MEHKLFRKLEDGERIEEGDVWGTDGDSCRKHIGKVFRDEDFWSILRPVYIQTTTGSTDETEEKPVPHPVYEEAREVERLKLLREHYAGLAMQGFCANPAFETRQAEQLVEWSVEQADALIAALNKKEEAA